MEMNVRTINVGNMIRDSFKSAGLGNAADRLFGSVSNNEINGEAKNVSNNPKAENKSKPDVCSTDSNVVTGSKFKLPKIGDSEKWVNDVIDDIEVTDIENTKGVFMENNKLKSRNLKLMGRHPITKVDEYVRGLYIDVLCSLARYAVKDSESRLSFVERIHAAAGLSTEFPEHIKNAMNITPERFDELFKQCKENDLTVIFVVDCMLIACADGKPNSKQIAFITEMFDALGLSKDEVSVLAELAAAILEQCSDRYFSAMKNAPGESVEKIAKGIFTYIREFVSGVIVNTSELVWVYSSERDGLMEVVGDTHLGDPKQIIFENVRINTSSIEGCNHLVFRNCYGKTPFELMNNERVFFLNCEFCINTFDVYDNFFEIGSVKSVLFKWCDFTDMRFGNTKGGTAGMIRFVDNSCHVFFEDSKFNDIECIGGWSSIITGKSTPASLTVKNCNFIDCAPNGSLFPNVSFHELENNTYLNCKNVFDK